MKSERESERGKDKKKKKELQENGRNCLLPTAWTDIPIKSGMMIYEPTMFRRPSNRCGAGRLLVYNTLAAAPAPSNDKHIHALSLYLFAATKGIGGVYVLGLHFQ